MAPTGTKHFKTNPDCTANRHGPDMASWRRGCACESAHGAMRLWASEKASTGPCRAATHATEASWKDGCRHAAALIAHEEWKARRRDKRVAALAIWRATGQCAAERHIPTDYSYYGGCRCPETLAAYDRRHADSLSTLRKKFGTTAQTNRWRQGDRMVDRNNLFLLVHGFIDRPTGGERLAATAILMQRNGRNGPLEPAEIAERIGVNPHTIPSYVARMRRLREERPLRKLADIRDKAARVAAAAGRKERVRAEHAGSRRKAATSATRELQEQAG